MKIETKELTPALWSDVEALFGATGACGGCWCQAWRIGKGESWGDVQGAVAKRRFKRGVSDGSTHGIVAYVDGIPIGWCVFGPRGEFPRLNRAPSFKCDDAEQVWSIPCFFVKSPYHQKGVARALLEHALRALKKRGAKIAEGYPVKPDKDGKYIAAFSWTGTRSLFAKAGFKVAGNREGGKQRVRRRL
jgi:GNAT superfamily N-acetyltransferase